MKWNKTKLKQCTIMISATSYCANYVSLILLYDDILWNAMVKPNDVNDCNDNNETRFCVLIKRCWFVQSVAIHNCGVDSVNINDQKSKIIGTADVNARKMAPKRMLMLILSSFTASKQKWCTLIDISSR